MTIKSVIRYRYVWMGIAMLWVIFFHMNTMFHSTVVRMIKNTGYGGVDIFLFASGIGNYYSYLRDEKPLDFLRRRISRLAPVYIPFIIIWCIYYLSIGKLYIYDIPGNVLGIQGFSISGRSFNWYLNILIICYLLNHI